MTPLRRTQVLTALVLGTREYTEAYPRAVSTRPRWPGAVFVVVMIAGALAVGLFVYVLWGVSHFG